MPKFGETLSKVIVTNRGALSRVRAMAKHRGVTAARAATQAIEEHELIERLLRKPGTRMGVLKEVLGIREPIESAAE